MIKVGHTQTFVCSFHQKFIGVPDYIYNTVHKMHILSAQVFCGHSLSRAHLQDPGISGVLDAMVCNLYEHDFLFWSSFAQEFKTIFSAITSNYSCILPCTIFRVREETGEEKWYRREQSKDRVTKAPPMKTVVFVTRATRPAVVNELWHWWCVSGCHDDQPAKHALYHSATKLVAFTHQFVCITLRTKDLLLTRHYVSPLSPILGNSGFQ